MRSLLGFGNFYRPFIKNYALITLPLTRLTKKDIIFQWRQEVEDAAFVALINAFTSGPVLVHPILIDQFTIEVDASNYAIGAVLLQKRNGKLHPVSHMSKTFNAAERNYDIYDKELLAIVYALRQYRQLVAGSPHKIIIFTDHLNLTYWRSPEKIS